MAFDDRIKNEFIQTHLRYVYNTEPPKLFHIWSAITCASAAMGRHVWVETGIKKMYPNMFCLLVGPPATRKNTAIYGGSNLLQECTGVKFAPDDTGGQRQGLISAIENSESDKLAKEVNTILDYTDFGDGLDFGGLEKIGNIQLDCNVNQYDKHSIFVRATEFGSFLGQNSLDMTRFLIKMWDGENFDYRLKKEIKILREPLLSLLGGTTSTDLATLLPTEAIGQGFMSRFILVYSPRKEKEVPPSKAFFDTAHADYLRDIYKFLYYELRENMTKTKEAEEYEDHLYLNKQKIQDTRFMYFSERRGDHLMKLAMVLCATEKRDFEQADYILSETERYMPDALGEYGLSPLALSRQKLLEFLQALNKPVTAETLWAMMKKDMQMRDFTHVLADLQQSNKITRLTTEQGDVYVAVDERRDAIDLISN